ncbi:MAG: type II secretion system secretin GspD [Nitrospirae bacterium]|nr:type II secretion system secretin GspD [Nitrospirota bacterium]
MIRTQKGRKYIVTALITAALVLSLLSQSQGQQQPQGQPTGIAPPSNVAPAAVQNVPRGLQLPNPPSPLPMPPGMDNMSLIFPPPPPPPPMLAPPGKGVPAATPAPDKPASKVSDNKTPVAMPTPSPQPKASMPLVQHSGPNNVSLAFDDADIFEIAHTVFGEILKVNYLIDPRVKGRITFKTVRPISSSDVLPIMSTIFRLNSVSIMEENSLYRIIPLADITKEPVGVRYGKDVKSATPRGFSIIQIVPLNFMSSKEMVEILTPFLSTGAVIKEVPGKNCLIISDTDENMQRLLQIINIFDDDAFKDVKVELFVFKNLSIKDAIDDLKNTFPLFTATTKDSLKMKYLPIERLNAILVVAPDEQYLKHFKKWVEIIDNVFEGAKPRVYVYSLQNSQAEHIMSILSQIFTDSGTSKSSQDKTSGLTTTDKSTSTKSTTPTSSLTTSTTKTDDKDKKDTKKSSSSSASASAINVSSSILVSPDTKIYYDDKLNALIIMALPKDYLYIEELIKKLDAVPRQVLIEALVVEVKLTDALKYGLQWFLANNITVNNHKYTGATMVEVGDKIGLTSPLFSTTSGISYAVFNGAGLLSAMIQALSTETEISVLSSPNILVSDNNEAKIQVGEKVPIVTSDTNVTGTTNIQRQYQYQDTGVILKVKPQINDSGLVKLDITQEVSDVSETLTTPGVDSPTINVRTVTTNLVVQDGSSIAIGGLIQDKITNVAQGIPFLSKIPIIGGLFGYKSKEHNRTELMVIITPRVVKSLAEAATMTEAFKDKLKGLQKMLADEKNDLMPGYSPPKGGNPSAPPPTGQDKEK